MLDRISPGKPSGKVGAGDTMENREENAKEKVK